MRFIDLEQKVFREFWKGNFSEVHVLIKQTEELYPERLDKTLFWKACAHAVQKEVDEAISALDYGLTHGIWWSPQLLLNDPDLNNLHHTADFKRTVEACEKIEKAQLNNANMELFTYGNNNSEVAILSLHWRGSNVKSFAPFWLNQHLQDNYYFAFPQSSQVYGYNSYCWDDPELANKEVKESFQTIADDFDEIKLTGASQGGKLAIEYTLNQTIKTNKFIAVVPAIKELKPFEELIKNHKNNLKGWIITGDQDHFYHKTCELHKLLTDNGIDCELIVIEGLGHYFPENFTQLLSNILEDRK